MLVEFDVRVARGCSWLRVHRFYSQIETDDGMSWFLEKELAHRLLLARLFELIEKWREEELQFHDAVTAPGAPLHC